jgi:hypothetical protein
MTRVIRPSGIPVASRAGGLVSHITGLQIVSFAEGLDGEPYVVDLGGTLHRVQAE